MLRTFNRPPFQEEHSHQISQELVSIFEKRRTIREFSQQKPASNIIKNAIKVASLAPSGANAQPWDFALIENKALKEEIRRLSEIEENQFYHSNPNEKWINDLKHLHTDEKKQFLTDAPYLIVIFYSHFHLDQNAQKKTHYYAKESVGLATGMLLSALHLSGLNTLTYTPKRMQFLNPLLDKPKTQRAFMIIATGLASDEARVPLINKKTIDEVVSYYK